MLPCWRASVKIAVLMPTTSPRTLSSGPPELPGLMAASVWSMSCERPSVMGKGRPMALITPTVTVCARSNGLPMAITQSPGSICAESPNFASASSRFGFSVELDQGAVGERVAADHLGLVIDVGVLAEERHLDLRGALDDVVVREDEAVLVDDEAGAGGLRPPVRAAGAGLAAAAAARRRRTAEAVVPAAEELGQLLRRCRLASVGCSRPSASAPWRCSGRSWRRSGR